MSQRPAPAEPPGTAGSAGCRGGGGEGCHRGRHQRSLQEQPGQQAAGEGEGRGVTEAGTSGASRNSRVSRLPGRGRGGVSQRPAPAEPPGTAGSEGCRGGGRGRGVRGRRQRSPQEQPGQQAAGEGEGRGVTEAGTSGASRNSRVSRLPGREEGRGVTEAGTSGASRNSRVSRLPGRGRGGVSQRPAPAEPPGTAGSAGCRGGGGEGCHRGRHQRSLQEQPGQQAAGEGGGEGCHRGRHQRSPQEQPGQQAAGEGGGEGCQRPAPAEPPGTAGSAGCRGRGGEGCHRGRHQRSLQEQPGQQAAGEGRGGVSQRPAPAEPPGTAGSAGCRGGGGEGCHRGRHQRSLQEQPGQQAAGEGEGRGVTEAGTSGASRNSRVSRLPGRGEGRGVTEAGTSGAPRNSRVSRLPGRGEGRGVRGRRQRSPQEQPGQQAAGDGEGRGVTEAGTSGASRNSRVSRLPGRGGEGCHRGRHQRSLQEQPGQQAAGEGEGRGVTEAGTSGASRNSRVSRLPGRGEGCHRGRHQRSLQEQPGQQAAGEGEGRGVTEAGTSGAPRNSRVSRLPGTGRGGVSQRPAPAEPPGTAGSAGCRGGGGEGCHRGGSAGCRGGGGGRKRGVTGSPGWRETVESYRPGHQHTKIAYRCSAFGVSMGQNQSTNFGSTWNGSIS